MRWDFQWISSMGALFLCKGDDKLFLSCIGVSSIKWHGVLKCVHCGRKLASPEVKSGACEGCGSTWGERALGDASVVLYGPMPFASKIFALERSDAIVLHYCECGRLDNFDHWDGGLRMSQPVVVGRYMDDPLVYDVGKAAGVTLFVEVKCWVELIFPDDDEGGS